MERSWRVGIVGINSLGLFLLEQFRLHPRFHVVVAVDLDANRAALTNGFADTFSNRPDAILTEPLDCVVFVDSGNEKLVMDVLAAGKSVVIAQPWLWSSQFLKTCSEMRLGARQFVTTYCPRRWSSDFLNASATVASGRLGSIRSAQLSIAEMSSDEGSREDFLKEQSFHLFDQLLLFVDSKPVRAFATATSVSQADPSSGRVATIEFANGCVAQLDLQFGSRLGYRTGWALEGNDGSYRNYRLYTTTTAGEIVDEPIANSNSSDENFFDELDRQFSGQNADLPTLVQGVRVAELIELVEKSVHSGAATRL